MRPQATSRTIARVRLRCSQASRILRVVVGPEDASAWRLGVEWRICACGAGASPSAAKRGQGGARRSCDAGRRGLPSRSRVPRSAAACGLRATALRCSAPRASSQDRGVAGLYCGTPRSAAHAPRPRCAGQPRSPARLAAPEIARRQPPPPRFAASPRLGERAEECARAGERDLQARVAIARAFGGTCARHRGIAARFVRAP